MRPLATLELQLRERKPRSRGTRAHTVIPAAAGDGVGRNEEMPPGISRLPITQAGVPAFARTGGFRAQPAPVCLPSKEWKMCFLNPGRVPSYGAQLVLGAMGEPPAHGRPREGWWGWGQRASQSSRAHSWPPLPLPRAEQSGSWGSRGRMGPVPHARPMPRLRPCCGCAAGPRSPPGSWENASATLHL